MNSDMDEVTPTIKTTRSKQKNVHADLLDVTKSLFMCSVQETERSKIWTVDHS